MTHFAQPHHHQTDYSYPFVHPQLSPAWPPPLTPHTASHELDLDLGLADVKVHTGSTDDLTLAKPHHHQLPPSFYSDSSAGAAASCRPTTSASGFSFFPRGIADQLPPLVPTHPPPHQQVPPNMQLQPPYDDRSQPYLLPAPIDNVQASAVDVDESVGPAMTEHPGVLVDMNMAEHGSTAAKAGIQTPIASWLAHMIVWLWYAKPRLQPNGGTSSPPDLGDPFRSPPLSDIDPQQLTPSPKFIDFVNMLLRVTMVSHSVTLVALLYIHRLKSRNYLPAGAGTEQRPFIASLILGNKYLDDNTYTNKTWADLTNLPTAEINKMESEFLQGLKFNLSISKAEFEAWRKLLDSYIYHRERAFNPMMPYVSPALSRTPDTPAYMPITATTETFRSYSESPPNNRNGSAGFYRGAAVYEHGRKRSAVDAFATDVVTPAALYESLRQPASRAQLHIPPPTQVIPDGPRTAHTPSVGMDGSLGRSSSLTRSNRQMARFPGRRGSIGGTPSHFVPSQEDLRHTATQHAAMNAGLGIVMDQGMSNMQVQAQMQAAQLEHGYGALMRPYDGAPVPMIPPEGMEYYSASARAHPGQDGAPRKAILRHQAPVQPFVTPHPPPYTHTPAPSMMMSGQQTPWYPSPGDIDLMTPGATPAGPSTAPTMVPTQYPHAQQMGHAPHYSIPGNFANAGPAAYLYEPSATFQYNGTPAHAPPHNHSQHNLHSNMQGLEQYRWQTRSEWSSPNLPHGGYRY